MERFYLIVNEEKEEARRAAALVAEYLLHRGCDCLRWGLRRGEEPGRRFRQRYRYTDVARIPPETECAIVLGGDGTLIQAARDVAGRGLPLFGVNMGHLAYLTQVCRHEEMIPALQALIEDRYSLETRMMLDGQIVSDGRVIARDIALNDMILGRSGLYTLKFQLYVNGQLLNDYSADGMIVATPTGSTAYNLSAGGPIAVPDARLLILTPICPHTLNSRSFVLSADSEIALCIGGDQEVEQFVSFDGDTAVPLKRGDRIEIRRSEVETTLVQLTKLSFMDNIRNKMRQI